MKTCSFLEQARQQGFATPGEYGLSRVEEDQQAKEGLLNGFREGWAAGMTGDASSASKLRDFIERDE